MVKNLLANADDMGWILGLGRSSGGRNGSPLQDSYVEIPWTEESGRLQSMRWQESDMTWQLNNYYFVLLDGFPLFLHFSYFSD